MEESTNAKHWEGGQNCRRFDPSIIAAIEQLLVVKPLNDRKADTYNKATKIMPEKSKGQAKC